MDCTVATSDAPPVVLGTMPLAWVQAMGPGLLRPGRLLRFAIKEVGRGRARVGRQRLLRVCVHAPPAPAGRPVCVRSCSLPCRTPGTQQAHHRAPPLPPRAGRHPVCARRPPRGRRAGVRGQWQCPAGPGRCVQQGGAPCAIHHGGWRIAMHCLGTRAACAGVARGARPHVLAAAHCSAVAGMWSGAARGVALQSRAAARRCRAHNGDRAALRARRSCSSTSREPGLSRCSTCWLAQRAGGGEAGCAALHTL